jgi:hypothetical protein
MVLLEMLSFCITRNSSELEKNSLIFIDKDRLSRFIQRHGKDTIINCLSNLVISKEIQFPYKRFTMENPITYFKALLSYQPTHSQEGYNIRGINS